MRNNIIVWGYWVRNLGDDLFLLSLIDRMKNSPYRIVIACARKYASYYRNMGIDVIENDSILYRVRRKILNLDPFVLLAGNRPFIMLGGSLFAENKNAHDHKKIRDLAYAIRHSSTSLIIGSNFGPYQSSVFKEKYYKLFSKTASICFRDKYSYNQFKKLDQVSYAPDAVLSGYWDKIANKSQKVYVGFSIMDFSNRQNLALYASAYENCMADLISMHCAHGDPVLLFSFCEEEGDLKACKRVRDLCDPGDKVKIIKYDDIDFIRCYNSCRRIYGSRFHSIILSLYYQINCIPIVYNEKTSHALESYFNGTNDAIFLHEFADIRASDIFNKKGLDRLDNDIYIQSKKQFEGLKLLNVTGEEW